MLRYKTKVGNIMSHAVLFGLLGGFVRPGHSLWAYKSPPPQELRQSLKTGSLVLQNGETFIPYSGSKTRAECQTGTSCHVGEPHWMRAQTERKNVPCEIPTPLKRGTKISFPFFLFITNGTIKSEEGRKWWSVLCRPKPLFPWPNSIYKHD